MTISAPGAQLVAMVALAVLLVGCRSMAVGDEPDVCGNGVCEIFEGNDTCPEDCPAVGKTLRYDYSYVDLDTGEVQTWLDLYAPPTLEGWDVIFTGGETSTSNAVVNENTGVKVAYLFDTLFEDVDYSFVADADWHENDYIGFNRDDVLLVRTDRGAVYKVWLDCDHYDYVEALWAPLSPN